jgi:hypothetical protein
MNSTHAADMSLTGLFLRHTNLAGLWCRWNGQRGTQRQVARVMRQLRIVDLERMLTERGVVVD